MTFTINVNITDSRTVLDVLAGIVSQLNKVIAKEENLVMEIDTLKAQVAANTSVIGSAKDLIVGLKTKLDAAIASGDPAQLTALSNELKTSDDALAAAVAANTPTTVADGGTGSTPTP